MHQISRLLKFYRSFVIALPLLSAFAGVVADEPKEPLREPLAETTCRS